MKKRLSSSIGTIIVLCAIIIISLQKYQPDKEVITTFIYEWLNDDSRAETEYKKILETGSFSYLFFASLIHIFTCVILKKMIAKLKSRK